MSGLYIKLDAEYASDDKLIAAGPMGELLYVRSLAFCKRQMVDGIIRTNQLNVIALGIPSAKKHAEALVESGAWTLTAEGWQIANWLKHNKSAEQINEDREMRRVASMEANHAQHHVGPDKKASPKCELCRAARPPKSAPQSEANRNSNRLPKEEPEPEEEEKEEPQPEPEGSIGASVRQTFTPCDGEASVAFLKTGLPRVAS